MHVFLHKCLILVEATGLEVLDKSQIPLFIRVCEYSLPIIPQKLFQFSKYHQIFFPITKIHLPKNVFFVSTRMRYYYLTSSNSYIAADDKETRKKPPILNK